jgi:hypothetical protein
MAFTHPAQRITALLPALLLCSCGGAMIEDLPLTPALQHYVALSKVKYAQAESAQVKSILQTLDAIKERMDELENEGSGGAKNTPDDISE